MYTTNASEKLLNKDKSQKDSIKSQVHDCISEKDVIVKIPYFQSHYMKLINSTYKKVLKEGFLVLDVKNCVSAIDDVKRFWFVVCSRYVSNNKFNLRKCM